MVLFASGIESIASQRKSWLDERWTICPTGGLDKVWSFSSLFRGNNLNIAVLCDYGKGDKNKVERLRQSQILKSERVLTTSDFTEKLKAMSRIYSIALSIALWLTKR